MSTPDRPFLAPSGFDTSDTVKGPAAPATPDKPVVTLDGPSIPAPDRPTTPDTGSTPGELLPPYHEMELQQIREVYRQHPDEDKGIGRLLDSIEADMKARGSVTPRIYEKTIWAFARSEAVFLQEERLLDEVDFSEGDDGLGRLRAAQTKMAENAQNDPDEAQRAVWDRRAVAVANFITRHDTDESDTDRQKAAIHLYTVGKQLDNVEQGERTPEQRKAAADARYELQKRTFNLAGKHRDYPYTSALIKHLPPLDAQQTLDNPDALADDEQLMDTARQQLADARTGLADIHAKRQKRVFGFDRMNPNAVGKKALETQARQRKYNDAVQGLIAQEIKAKVTAGEAFKNEAALNEFIATRTVDEAMALDKEIIEKYGQANTKLSKAINWMAGRQPNGEPDNSRKAKFRRLTLRYGAPVGFLTLSVVTGGSFAVAAASGMFATAKLYANFETAGRDARMKKAPGLLKKEDVIKELGSARSGQSVYDESLQEYRDATEEDYHIAKSKRAASLIAKAASKETNKQKRHATKRAIGAFALGVGAAVGSRLIGQWINGSDVHGAAPGHGDVPPGGETPPGGGDVPGGEPGGGAPGPQEVPGGTPDDGGIHVNPPGPEAPVPAPHEFAPGTFNVHHGEGYYDIMQRMGIPAEARDDVLASVRRQLAPYSYFEPGDPMPRIPRAGTLPQGAIDILTKAAGR